MATILHVTTGLENGGAEAILYRLIVADVKNSHQVISLTGAGCYGAELTAKGIAVHTLGMPRGRITVKGLWRLGRLMSRIRADVVQTWMYHADAIGGVTAKLLGKSAIVWCIRASDLPAHSNSAGLKTILWLGARLSNRIPARIICNSRAGARVHVESGYAPAKIVVVVNGYDTGRLAPSAAGRARLRASWNIAPDTIVLGIVARWHPVKDHENLFRSLSLLKTAVPRPWTCVLVGSNMTPENGELVALVSKYGIAERVKLLGARADIPDVMSALDLHVLSSKSEGLPNAIAEAMSCGTPCVTTDVGDAGVLVESTGWIVPRSNPAAFADAMGQAFAEMQDGVRWQTRKDACRARIVERYTIDRMVAAYNEVWREATGGAE